jgi:hypothetical protein
MAKQLSKADLHMHTNFSDGSASVEAVLNYVANKTDLSIIAITDHNTIEGAQIAQKLVKERNLPFSVIVGEEISTKSGHILGLFLNKRVQPNLSVRKTLKLIKAQNGLAIPSHPFYFTIINATSKHEVMNGIGLKNIVRNLNLISAIETVDGTPTLSDENFTAHFWNATLLHLPETGGSDAHILTAIGMGYTLFEGTTAADLRHAIETAQTRAVARRWKFLGLMQYAYYFLPEAIRLGWYTLLHGKRKIKNT